MAKANRTWQAYDSGASDFSNQALGSLCFVVDPFDDHLPCNPSFLAYERDPRFQADFVTSEDVQGLGDSYDFIQGRNSHSMEDSLVAGRKHFNVLGGFEMSYKQKLWGVSWIPRRVFLQTHSYSVPVATVNVSGLSEQSGRVQLATYWSNDFYIGLQGRVSDRQGVFGQSTVLDQEASLMTGAGTQPFERKARTYFTLEPGMHYQPLNNWDGRVSFMLRNLGVSKQEDDDLIPESSAVLGASLSPYIGPAKFHFGISGEFYRRSWHEVKDQATLGSGVSFKKVTFFMAGHEQRQMYSLLINPGSMVFGLAYIIENADSRDREEIYFSKFGLQF